MSKSEEKEILFDDQGQIFYENGTLRYEGSVVFTEKGQMIPMGKGKSYYRNGALHKEGNFLQWEILEGKEYALDGKDRFEGEYRVWFSETGRVYSAPYHGAYYENGECVYCGEWIHTHIAVFCCPTYGKYAGSVFEFDGFYEMD